MRISRYRTGEMDRDGNMLWPFPTAPRGIYVASSMDNIQKALVWTIKLTRAGFEVVSRWPHEHWPDVHVLNKPKLAEEWAQHNVDDLDRSDTVVFLADLPSSSGGYHFELGYAVAKGKNTLVLGPRWNVFYHFKDVRIMRDESSLVEFLQSKEHRTTNEIHGEAINAGWLESPINLSEEVGL